MLVRDNTPTGSGTVWPRGTETLYFWNKETKNKNSSILASASPRQTRLPEKEMILSFHWENGFKVFGFGFRSNILLTH